MNSAADSAVHYNPWWSSAIGNQASDCAQRTYANPGQVYDA